MKRSTERILTTHAGSLARPADLLDMMRAKESGQPYDLEAFAQRVHTAVAEVVRKQIDSGMDIVSDGEQGKPGFLNYIKDRLTGFESRERLRPLVFGAHTDFPDYEPRPTGTLGFGRLLACVGPIQWKDRALVQTDMDNFKAASAGVHPPKRLSPPSPRVASPKVSSTSTIGTKRPSFSPSPMS